ncbi:hypothetical protein [Paenilisteria weihenstephanensis]|uniref:Immunity protein 30 domain-containing protein n=1 Tax=Listeria weihenstephanensis TaxID=1006155 RepID=A0A1S7FYP2_9LIST|nr:hypothetical protein [Listeria weihenstephanensis]AQY52543.1 hypothetical protein UE46_10840 [Listeria weihenstephanensis]
MNLEEYEELPDLLSTDKLVALFQGAVDTFKAGAIDKELLLPVLIELTDRQVNTYELLENEVREQVDRILCSLWNTYCYNDVDRILSIVVNLGLKDCFRMAQKAAYQNENIDKKIMLEISEAVAEVGSNILNPYAGIEGM